VAAVHIEWHGDVLVHDDPLPTLLFEAHGRPDPDAGLIAVRPGAADPVEAGAEGDIIAGRDVEIANVVADRALERSEPFLQTLPVSIRSTMKERGREIVEQDIRRAV